MTYYEIPPTAAQREFVSSLQRKLRLTDAALDQHCRETFDRPYREMDRHQVSDLIDELKGWEAVPANLQRAMGQLDLFEVPS